MSPTSIFLLIFSVVGMSGGQVLFKLAADRGKISEILVSPYLWIALVLYCAVTFTWVLVLREMGLGRAYALIAACYVLVPIGSMIVFGEKLGLSYFAGIAFIVAGIFLTLRS